MLYERWCNVVQNAGDELALIQLSTGEIWTFRALDREAERETGTGAGPVFPQGMEAVFVLEVLRAWRRGRVVCPLEPGQSVPNLAGLPPQCVHVKTTSASTGTPRLIAFTEEQLLADVSQIVATMGLGSEWPNVAAVSLSHSYGFSNLVLPLLTHGIPLILAESPLPESLRRAAEFFPSVTIPAVPALWRAWLESKTLPGNIRLAISAGAPLPLPLEEQAFRQFGLKIHNFYGATECGGIAYDRSPTPRAEPTCVGSAMAGVQLSLNADDCLRVCSAAAGLTYWPEPSPQLAGGCYQSSDLVKLELGQVFLRGRQSDLINVAGRKVSPESIERILSGHPEVEACLVFGVPSADHDRTDVIVACVVARACTNTESLRQHLLRQLPAWQVPRDWWFVPDLRLNGRGKVSRAEWRKHYLNGRSLSRGDRQ